MTRRWMFALTAVLALCLAAPAALARTKLKYDSNLLVYTSDGKGFTAAEL